MSDITIEDRPEGSRPGDRIGGFEIKRLLGRGAMGEVYLAHQLSMGRDVALKMLRPELTSRRTWWTGSSTRSAWPPGSSIPTS